MESIPRVGSAPGGGPVCLISIRMVLMKMHEASEPCVCLFQCSLVLLDTLSHDFIRVNNETNSYDSTNIKQ